MRCPIGMPIVVVAAAKVAIVVGMTCAPVVISGVTTAAVVAPANSQIVRNTVKVAQARAEVRGRGPKVPDPAKAVRVAQGVAMLAGAIRTVTGNRTSSQPGQNARKAANLILRAHSQRCRR